MDYKNIFASTTIQGTIISLLVMVVQIFKINIASEEITQIVSGIFGIVGVVLTVIGRLKSEKPLGLFGKSFTR